MKKMNLGILTFPIEQAGTIPLSSLIEIINQFSENMYLITGDSGYYYFKDDKRIFSYQINHKKHKNSFLIILEYIITQIKITCMLFKITKNVDKWIFFIGGDTLVFPMLLAKLFRKEVFLLFASSSTKIEQSSGNKLYKFGKILSDINCKLADKILVYSPTLIKDWNLVKYEDKIEIAREHFLNFDEFKIEKHVKNKENLIGYIGRLSYEKGILNFIKSIPELLNINKDLKFWIVGNGKLKNEIICFLNNENLNDKVILFDWISHEDIPKILNELKLIVVPSFTEGLPNIILEAMACGTTIITTPVGAVPDFIQDGKNGFIIPDNSTKNIVNTVISALNSTKIDEMIKINRSIVKNEFSFDNTKSKWEKILEGHDVY
ncbi:glycosyltransferase family 4 protein [Methanobacterium sp. SMA-27]|uniref:glycosyltransferase family 4 protein n=1 Tax=Methanobacterium sp. SMA-27 TaxID=1495336 RepID=UPI00064FB51F|nr:glycosyltransferase family 4 protein [Methanobacterium sp. SMA-27]